MAVHFDIHTIPSSRTGKPGTQRTSSASAGQERFSPPRERATVNFIPPQESLATLIQGAIAALKQGIYWERGTILNLLA